MNRLPKGVTSSVLGMLICLVLLQAVKYSHSAKLASFNNHPASSSSSFHNEDDESRPTSTLVKRSTPNQHSPFNSHSIMRFGRAPHNIMHFGKRADGAMEYPYDNSVNSDETTSDAEVRYVLVPVSTQLLSSALHSPLTKKARLNDETDNVFMHFG